MIYAPLRFADKTTAQEYGVTLGISFKIVFDNSDGFQVVVNDSDINKPEFKGF